MKNIQNYALLAILICGMAGDYAILSGLGFQNMLRYIGIHNAGFVEQAYQFYLAKGIFMRLFFLLICIPVGLISSRDKETSIEKKSKAYTAIFIFSCSFILMCFVHKFPQDVVLFLYPALIVLILVYIDPSFAYIKTLIGNSGAGQEGKLLVPMEKKKYESAFSINFKTSRGWINVTNPFQGLLTISSAGGGKTAIIASQILDQLIPKGVTGFFYDYKFPDITPMVLRSLAEYPVKDDPRKVWIINFRDPRKSHRCNPIHPKNLKAKENAVAASKSVLFTLSKEWIQKEDFWSRSAVAYYSACMYYLAKYKKEYCTLAHLNFMVASNGFEAILWKMKQDAELEVMAKLFIDAVEQKAGAQIAGQKGSLQVILSEIHSKSIAWVTSSGHDFDLNVNDPANPGIICIGNDGEKEEAINPVISLFAYMTSTALNQDGKLPSLFMIDELPTLYVPGLAKLPATARSRKVATILLAQDIAQLVERYGQNTTNVILANMGTMFCGTVKNMETAEYFSKLLGDGEFDEVNRSFGKNGEASGKSVSKRYKRYLFPTDLIAQPSGDFCGVTTISPQEKKYRNKPFFADTILLPKDRDFAIAENKGKKLPTYPVNNFFHFFDGSQNLSEEEQLDALDNIMEENFLRIRAEVEGMVTGFIKEYEEFKAAQPKK